MTKLSSILMALTLTLPLAACNKTAAADSKKDNATAVSGSANVSGAVGDDPAVPRLATGAKARCAVTGEDFTVKPSTVQVTYGGKRYAFCCADCQPTFAKNPAKYAK